MLTCPVCGGALALSGGTWRCEAGHAFDRARQGYVDLLPVGHGRSGITGDTAAMARARRRFLARGHYGPLVARIVERVKEHLGGRPDAPPAARADAVRGTPVVVESGCGTGHYIGAVAAAVPEARAFGFDVSAPALRLAARDHPRVTFAVNDATRRLCLPDASADVLLDVFAPRNAAEFRRVLRADGLLLVVIPGERHLVELRERLPLLDIRASKRERTLASLAPAFEPGWAETLERQVVMEGEEIAALVGMTPSAHHLDDDDLAGLLASGNPASPAPPTGRHRVTLSFLLLGCVPAVG